MRFLLIIPYLLIGIVAGVCAIRYMRYDVETDKEADAIGFLTLCWPLVLGWLLCRLVGWQMHRLAIEFANFLDRRRRDDHF